MSIHQQDQGGVTMTVTVDAAHGSHELADFGRGQVLAGAPIGALWFSVAATLPKNPEFGFRLDPCCRADSTKCERYFTPYDSRLLKDWGSEQVFMNPPYSQRERWMAKTFGAAQAGATVVCLVPPRTDTAWWHQWAMQGEIRFVKGRLKFGDSQNSASFPLRLWCFGRRTFGCCLTHERPIFSESVRQLAKNTQLLRCIPVDMCYVYITFLPCWRQHMPHKNTLCDEICPFQGIQPWEKSDLRALSKKLEGMACVQLNYLISTLEQPDNVINPESANCPVDESSSWSALHRIRSMLSRLKAIACDENNRAGREKIHDVILHPYENRVSSPLLLAIHASLCSHANWSTENYHDLHSAKRTFAFLKRCGSWDARLIALLVALKNVFRTSVGVIHKDAYEAPEVGVWQDNSFLYDDDAAAQQTAVWIAQLLRDECRPYSDPDCTSQSALTPPYELILEALSLVAEAWENRNDLLPAESVRAIRKFTGKVQGALFSKTSREAIPETSRATLIIFEFSRFALSTRNLDGPSSPDTRSLRRNVLGQIAEHLVSQEKRSQIDRTVTLPAIIWVSLDRYFSTKHSQGIARLVLARPPQLDDIFRTSDNQTELRGFFRSIFSDPFAEASFWRLHLEGESGFTAVFGPPTVPSLLDNPPWDPLKAVIDRYDTIYPTDSSCPVSNRFPWPYAMRVLQILASIYPRDFSRFDVHRPTSGVFGHFNTIWLPTHPPSVNDLENALNSKTPLEPELRDRKLLEPKLLCARALASLISNQRMAFGISVPRLVSDSSPGDLDGWRKAYQWAEKRNLHKEKLDDYVGLYLRPRVDAMWPVQSPSRKKDNNKILGIDIGSSFIKIAAYEYDYAQKTLSQIPLSKTRVSIKPPGGTYRNMQSFVEYVSKEFALGRFRGNLLALGVTWPGAVAGPAGSEYVASYSGILKYFDIESVTTNAKGEKEGFWKIRASDLHDLRVREKFGEYFKVDHVRLLNDGVAHVIASRAFFPETYLARGETEVGLFAGTGTAMAVLLSETGRPLFDLLAEAGRHIVDIGCEFPQNSSAPFSKGVVGGGKFNKDTLSTIAECILKKWDCTLSAQNASKALQEAINSWLTEKRKDERWLAENREKDINTEDGLLKDQLKESFGYLIGYILEKKGEKDKAENFWKDDPDCKIECNLEEYLRYVAVCIEPNHTPQELAEEATCHAGKILADVVAMAAELYGSKNVFIGGGPLIGVTGQRVRECARDRLEKLYNYDVVESAKGDPGRSHHHLARLLRFPEPKEDIVEGAERGAAEAAAWLLEENQAGNTED